MSARENLRALAMVCGVSFLLNLIWENVHYFLYTHYKGGPITKAVLLHATFVDAFIITTVAAVFILVPFLNKRLFLMPILWIIIAIGIELWALGTLRWAYKDIMPLVPLLGVGLSPTVQLALTGSISYLLVFRYRPHG